MANRLRHVYDSSAYRTKLAVVSNVVVSLESADSDLYALSWQESYAPFLDARNTAKIVVVFRREVVSVEITCDAEAMFFAPATEKSFCSQALYRFRAI